MITFRHRGNFKKTEKFLLSMKNKNFSNILSLYAEKGLRALQQATPVDSGVTAFSWSYSIEQNRNGISITWFNDNVNDGVNIAIILQYGHGTGTGGYVKGRDYINPALRPIFDQLAEELWREVVSS